MTNDLRPCPFCGGDAKEFTGEDAAPHRWTVECDSCGAHVGSDTRHKARAKWNRRAERTCRMEAFLLGEFFTGNKHVTGTDMSDEEFVALLKELEEDTIIRCSSCHFPIPSGADVQYTQTDDGAWAVEATGTRIEYCPHCGARVVEVSE